MSYQQTLQQKVLPRSKMSKASNQRNSNGFDDNLPVVYKNYNAQYN